MADRSELFHLIKQLKHVPEVIHLGTPQVLHTDTIRGILEFGRDAIPFLTACLKQGEKCQVAQAVYVLGELHAISIIPDLLALRDRIQQIEFKMPWDYAILGQINVALQKLQQSSTSGVQ